MRIAYVCCVHLYALWNIGGIGVLAQQHLRLMTITQRYHVRYTQHNTNPTESFHLFFYSFCRSAYFYSSATISIQLLFRAHSKRTSKPVTPERAIHLI